eukprot:m.40222 g.40222  ORF g.40222 m.40222 type:complete len:737 (-) comp6912_c0_seq2:1987-4197(-)
MIKMKKEKTFEKTLKSILKVARNLLTPGKTLTQREWQFFFQDIHIISSGAATSMKWSNAAQKGEGRLILYSELESLLLKHVTKILRALELLKGVELLFSYRENFRTFSLGSGYLNLPCKPLNEEFIKASSVGKDWGGEDATLSIDNLAMKLWKETVFDALKDKIVPELVNQIQIAREGNDIDDKMVADTLLSMIDMCSWKEEKTVEYTNLFETNLLNSTNEYYSARGEEFLSTHTIEEYVSWAHDVTSKELYRCNVVLPQFSQDKLMKRCLKTLALDKKDQLSLSAKEFIEGDRDKELSKMYDLVKRAAAFDILTEPFEEVIIQRGKAYIQSLKANNDLNAMSFYEKMRQLHEHYTQLCDRAFNKDHTFLACVDKACVVVMNLQKKKAPEFLAKVCDLSLKKSSKAPTQDALENRLEYVVKLFKYLQDKDIFEKFYSKYLAKRLIHNSSASEEAEQGMIARLKALCGFEFTGKLQRMFNDVTISAELNSQFSSSSSGASSTVDINIIVAQRGSWPLSSLVANITLPPSLSKCMESFSMFYKEKYTGRKLIWMHHLGTIDMKATFGKKRLEFHSTLFQAVVLLLFNSGKEVTIAHVAEQTQLDAQEAEKTLDSLITCKLVKKSPTDGMYILNEKYKSKRHRVKITVAVQREVASKEEKQTHQAIDGDRKLFLQAVTVRCMKLRKSINYNNLVQEIIQLSKSQFTPAVPAVKKCIEELIDKEYIRRDQNERNKLFYIA